MKKIDELSRDYMSIAGVVVPRIEGLPQFNEGVEMKSDICAHCNKTIEADEARVCISDRNLFVCKSCEDVTVLVYEIEYGGSSYIDRDLNNIIPTLEDMDEGDNYNVSRERMKIVEYLSLPEFDGF
jgi:RNase P subunit RPR2